MGVAYNPKIVTDGLVAYLDAANTKSYPGTGTAWNDLSGNGNNGIIVNAPTFANGAFTFNGTTQYVDLGDKFNYAVGSISFWTKLTTSISIPHSGNVRPWGKNTNFEARWGGGNTTSGASLAIDLGASIGPPANLQSIKNSWLNTEWYNITITWDTVALTSKMYIQGLLDTTGSCAAALTSLTGNFYLARSGTAYYAGSISNFSVYNRELAALEVYQNFNATKSRYGL